MLFTLGHIDRLDEVADDLRSAQAVTPGLMARVLVGSRSAAPGLARRAARISRLIELEAWTEAALTVVELELPQWKVRRLVCEEGVWLCSLTRQWKLPDWLADDVEARHESLPLAILTAVVEARRCDVPSSRQRAGSVPQCGAAPDVPAATVCCDNFG